MKPAAASTAAAAADGEDDSTKRAKTGPDVPSVLKKICSALGHAKPGPKLDLATRLFLQFVDGSRLDEEVPTEGGPATVASLVFAALVRCCLLSDTCLHAFAILVSAAPLFALGYCSLLSRLGVLFIPSFVFGPAS